MTIAQLQALKALIAATPECNGLRDRQQIATILNTPGANKVTSSDLPRRTVLRILAGRGIISACYDAARDTQRTHQLRSICFAVEHMLGAGDGGLDMADPGVIGMIDALVAAGLAQAADKTALTNATKHSGSPAQAAGLGWISAGEVDDAMRLP